MTPFHLFVCALSFGVFTITADNRSKRRIANSARKRNIGMMLKKYGAHSVTITPQMKAAACHYLSSGKLIFNDIFTFFITEMCQSMS